LIISTVFFTYYHATTIVAYCWLRMAVVALSCRSCALMVDVPAQQLTAPSTTASPCTISCSSHGRQRVME